MHRYFDPEEVVREYFEVYLVNPHNTTSFNSLNINKKIENLRHLITSHFLLDDYETVFLPNSQVVEDVLEHNLKIFSSDHLYLISTYNLDKKFKNISQLESVNIVSDQTIFFFFEDVSEDFDFSIFQTIKKNNVKSFIFVNLDYSIYLTNYTWTKHIDFLTFNPAFSLDVDGVVVLMFKKTHTLNPLYVGSNDSEHYSLECGTQNYPALLLLERYFYFLVKEGNSLIKKEIDNMKIEYINIFDKKSKFLRNFNNKII